jgi:hypothetical protein
MDLGMGFFIWKTSERRAMATLMPATGSNRSIASLRADMR